MISPDTTARHTARTLPDFTGQRDAARRFAQGCKALAERGLKPLVLSKRDNPNEWAKWQSYFRSYGMRAIVDLMADQGEITVPCLDPIDFVFPADVQPDRRVKD